jgi:hypothetical protein
LRWITALPGESVLPIGEPAAPTSRAFRMRFGKGYLEFKSAPPSWLSDLLGRLCALGELPSNWDSYGGLPIEPSCAVGAAGLMLSLMDRTTPIPSLVPTNRGGIQLEWHENGVDLEIEVSTASGIRALFEDLETGHEEQFTVANDLGRLTPLMQRLSRNRKTQATS